MKIKQIVIVEGKTDTAKLKQVFGKDNIETIETNGLALNNETLDFIKALNRTRGVIIFTDPDGPGIKIRDTINAYLDFKCFHAFINKKEIKNEKKIGIAEAETESIKKALENIVKFDSDNNDSISWEEFLKNDFFKTKNRIKIANHFNWSEKINSKKLFKWLNLLNLNVDQIKKIIEE
ncbi:ribonuclease M5 [Spiroplasma helicoides]|uniref:Ribonuclease M5 n=1 Tax=Spiroplasma helicoides TaxID=216938 RepID=A0A1B3SMC9_9MOLU|nr:ribonuclease M5 [Spiroplasma helicoides]AOG61089.1 ribonuclease M5 [Spiroplasma helicoides]